MSPPLQRKRAHPDIHIYYQQVRLELTRTTSELSRNDFVLAGRWTSWRNGRARVRGQGLVRPPHPPAPLPGGRGVAQTGEGSRRDLLRLGSPPTAPGAGGPREAFGEEGCWRDGAGVVGGGRRCQGARAHRPAISLALAGGVNSSFTAQLVGRRHGGGRSRARGAGVILTADFTKREEYETLSTAPSKRRATCNPVNSASIFPLNTLDTITFDD